MNYLFRGMYRCPTGSEGIENTSDYPKPLDDKEFVDKFQTLTQSDAIIDYLSKELFEKKTPIKLSNVTLSRIKVSNYKYSDDLNDTDWFGKPDILPPFNQKRYQIEINLLDYFIDPEILYSIYIDSNYTIYYTLSIPYSNTSSKRINLTQTESKTDFHLNRKYKGIILKFRNHEVFNEVYKRICNVNNDTDYFKKEVNVFFDKTIYDYVRYPDILNLIIQQTPNYVLSSYGIEYIRSIFTNLLVYDKGKYIVDGWVKNSSSSIIKLLSAITDRLSFYNYFKNKPELIIQMYHSIDIKSQIPFAYIMESIILSMKYIDPKYEFKTVSKFIIDENTSIDGNVTESSKFSINLKNQKLHTRYSSGPHHPANMDTIETSYETIKEGNFHPFDIIEIKQIVEGKPIIGYQTALLLKAQADNKDWLGILYAAEAIATISALVITLATLGTTTPATTLITFLTDLLLAGAAYGLSNAQESLVKDKEGEELLNKHKEVIKAINLITIAVALPTLIKLGYNLIRGGKFAPHILNDVENLMNEGMLKALKFQDEAVTSCKILSSTDDAYIKLSSDLYPENFKKLIEADVIFVKQTKTINGEVRYSYAGIYKGVRLEEGTLENLRKYFDSLSKKPSTQLVNELDGVMEELIGLNMRTTKIFPLGIELEVLSSNLLKKYILELEEKMLKKGFKLEIEWIDKTHNLYFTGLQGRLVVGDKGPIKLIIRKECSKMAWFHENLHIDDLLKMGRNNYRKMVLNEPWVLEWNVWEGILKNRNKYREIELVNAYGYVKKFYDDSGFLHLFKENKEMELLLIKYNK